MSAKRLGRICSKSSVLFLCDMQEKFRKTIQFYPQVLHISSKMLRAAQALEIPVVVTEQYPKGLGPTVPELNVQGCPIFPKTQFSMLIPEVENHLKKLPEVKSVILCGIEAHACILQTVLDLVEKNYDVHVVTDAVSSRLMGDRQYALDRIKDAGAYLTTSESLLLMLCVNAASPQFKLIKHLLTEAGPDNGKH